MKKILLSLIALFSVFGATDAFGEIVKATDTFTGYSYDSEYNLWKAADDAGQVKCSYYYGPNWSQIADPEMTKDGNAYTWFLPTATDDQWQAQCTLTPDTPVHLSGDTSYDFSCILRSDRDLNVTIKVYEIGRNNNFLFLERVPITANQDYVFYMSEYSIVSADCEVVFDFGGNPANTTATVKNIVLKNHINDDGTVLPNPEEELAKAIKWVDVNSRNNLMTQGSLSVGFVYWADNGWNKLTDPTVTITNRTAEIVVNEDNGTNQWQGQVCLETGVAVEAGKVYDFTVSMAARSDLYGITVKGGAKEDEYSSLFYARYDLRAYMLNDFMLANFVAPVSTDNLVLVFDFPGCTEGEKIQILDIILQEHGAPLYDWDYEGDTNLWKAVDEGSAIVSTAGGDDLGNEPQVNQTGDTWDIYYPSDGKWQATFAINTSLTLSASKKYNLYFMIEYDPFMPFFNVALADLADYQKNDGFFCNHLVNEQAFDLSDRRPIYRYKAEGVTLSKGADLDDYSLIFKFVGQRPQHITISKICLEEAGDVDESEGINTLSTEGSVGSIYSIYGQRLAAPQQGLNIINNHKVFIK